MSSKVKQEVIQIVTLCKTDRKSYRCSHTSYMHYEGWPSSIFPTLEQKKIEVCPIFGKNTMESK